MKKVILLATGWEPDYWEKPKIAPYPTKKYSDLSDWETLSKNCPLAGIGIYIKQTLKGKVHDYSNKQFVYLKIKGMDYDRRTKEPLFDFEPIQKSYTESKKLWNKLPDENKKLFSSIDADNLIKILKEIEEEPPKEWLNLIESGKTPSYWYDYIGKYFLELKNGGLSNDEFEDRIVALLTALGFDVTQKGHKLGGEYPDGVAAFEDEYAIVYDCKNRVNFIPTAEDKRAIRKYLEDEKKVRKEKNLFCAFIAKSFGEVQKDIFYFSVDAILYLLYKKLIMGFKFSLSPFKKILDDKMNLTIDTIDKEWI